MKNRFTLLFLSLFFSFTAINVYAHEDGVWDGVKNKDGSYVTGVLTASFDPSGGVLPSPTNFAYTGTTDLTLNIPVADPNNYSDPTVALNAQDGWSTTEPWVTGFANNGSYDSPTPLIGTYDNSIPGQIDPTSVVSGQSVRMFEVTTSPTTGYLGVTSIVRELTPGVEYVAVPASASQIAILPLKPLKEYTSYMAVLTNDIRDTDGNDATPDRTYSLGKTQDPWVDENGNSTNALFPDSFAAQLEGIRQIIQSMELNAAAYGIDPHDIVLAWTAQTQSISRTLKTLRALAQPAPTTFGPTGMDTSAVGGLGAADIHIGIITLPYYAGIPSAENPIAPLNTFWKAAPGAYVPPFDQFGLDPTSTNITLMNPMPVLTGMQTVPLLVTIPRGQAKPANGWPVVIFGHGLPRSRMDMLGMADGFAAAGYAVVAMDFPMHGVSPDATPAFAPFWIENTPFAPIANERTFDVDYISNTTGAPGPDGLIDPSGSHAFSAGLANMLVGRDTIRQGVADLSVLAVSIASMDFDGDGVPDTDGSNIAYAGQSWGGIHGTVFTAIEPLVTRSFLSVPTGGLANQAEASPTFQPVIQAGLAGQGVFPGTEDYAKFFFAWQTVLDSADPINWGAEAAMNTPILLHEVINDQTLPNIVPGSPLAGTEPLIKVMGLTAYSSTQQSADGLRAAGRFVPPATHGSWLDPSSSPAAFFEMQKQAVTFIGSFGGSVVVTDESTMVPVMQMQQAGAVADLTEKKASRTDRKKSKPGTVTRKGKASWLEVNKRSSRLDRFE